MKATLLSLAFLSLPAFASPQRDALLGTYTGSNGCYLKIVPAAGGQTDVTFTDDMSDRTLWGVGHSLEAQLARGANPLVFDHQRATMYDMTIHLEIQLEAGRPVSMRGTGQGVYGGTVVNCAFAR